MSISSRILWPLTLGLLCGCNGSNENGGTETSPPAPDVQYVIKGELNDTGIVSCASLDATQLPCPQAGLPRQDAELGRDAQALKNTLNKIGGGIAGFDWTKLDQSGNALAIQDKAWDNGGSEEEGNRWSCVRDNVTGLTWEIKESDPGHPRYTGHTYRWWLDGEDNNGAFPNMSTSGNCPWETCDTQTYVNWLNEQALCGFSDWRMPSVAELSSIAVLSNVIPAVDPLYFPDVKEPRFFTGQSFARDPSRAWYVYFSDASASFTNKGDASHVRLVRGD